LSFVLGRRLTMSSTWASCKPCCTLSDPVQDTVKVDTSLFNGTDKENVSPLHIPNNAPDYEKKEKSTQEERAREEKLRIDREAEERRKREEAEASAKAAARAAEERLRQEAAASARKAAEEERLRQEAAEIVRREAEEERLREEAAELARKEAEEAAEQERKQKVEMQLAQKKVAAWCKTHGYSDVQTPKTTMRGNKKYVLHTAVKNEDCDIVKMLLKCGAQKDAKDTKGSTALQLVEKMKSGRPRDLMLDALS